LNPDAEEGLGGFERFQSAIERVGSGGVLGVRVDGLVVGRC
jgi:hypothetical protein